MTITHTIRSAAAVLVTAAALAAPAADAAPRPVGGLSAGPVQPQVTWDHAKWKQCWTLSYAQGRQDGLSPNGATAYADLVCGDPPK
ncbi:hypothetical protein GKE82_13710 [Conexibacter sp. W3-3-2]|uniref:Uncharacterized protein n=1 Tax=Paraconexibacter algicola TaxID=2133960 RepID=A0A2T4UIF1_9ACTN|nr:MULTISPECIES: hypothetical protein [Solirubrobacterales]MTD45313.1 hypothetical protein [Conexibacter sp. W3-3-2]PTL59008.1 hypothetical protein C7Y72_04770 [Paraconexibacter algicola]